MSDTNVIKQVVINITTAFKVNGRTMKYCGEGVYVEDTPTRLPEYVLIDRKRTLTGLTEVFKLERCIHVKFNALPNLPMVDVTDLSHKLEHEEGEVEG